MKQDKEEKEVSKSASAAFAVLITIMFLAVIGTYLFSYFSLKNISKVEPVRGPTGPTGPNGKAGAIVDVGATGPVGPRGLGSQLYTLTLTSLFYWNYHGGDSYIFASQLPDTWSPLNIPLSVLFEVNGQTNYSIRNYDNNQSISAVKSMFPSTSSQVDEGNEKTSNYAGFDFIIIHTVPGQIYLPDPPGTTELITNKYYLLLRVNELEYDYFKTLYNGVVLNPENRYQLKPKGQVILTYIQ